VLQTIDPHLPVIVVTGWPCDESSDRARRAGAREVLSKPIDGSTMLSALEHVTHDVAR